MKTDLVGNVLWTLWSRRVVLWGFEEFGPILCDIIKRLKILFRISLQANVVCSCYFEFVDEGSAKLFKKREQARESPKKNTFTHLTLNIRTVLQNDRRISHFRNTNEFHLSTLRWNTNVWHREIVGRLYRTCCNIREANNISSDFLSF